MGLPQAKFEIVWLTTDWKTDAAISLFEAPSFNRAWTSVLAKTPHLEAIGKIFVWSFASSLSPRASVSIREAIWSIKDPVPPAQIEFILCSTWPDR